MCRAPLQRHLGKWDSPRHAALEFARDSSGGMRVSGIATWQGSRQGTAHVGDIDGPVTMREARPNAFRAHYADGTDSTGCVVDFLQLGRYLVASDSSYRGGMNVRFDDVYVRAAPPPSRRPRRPAPNVSTRARPTAPRAPS